MSERDSLSVLGLVVLIALGSAGASWEAGRRFERERHRCAVIGSVVPDECERRLADLVEANRSCAVAIEELARVDLACRSLLTIGPGPEVRR
jgi:hypothetical protein